MLRRMEAIVRRAAKTPREYGKSDEEIVELIAQAGKKQLRTRIQKESEGGEWLISDEQLSKVDGALRKLAGRLWELRNEHVSRSDFINACIMAMAYKPKEV